MEKFFSVKEESDLYKDYFKWIDEYENMKKIYSSFADKYGIEATQFIPRKNSISILPSERDKDKFIDAFTGTIEELGFRQIRVHSNIGKEWKRLVSDIAVPRKPILAMYISNIWGKYSARMFHVKDKLYGSLATGNIVTLPEWAIEMNGSEFYKILESNE